MCILIFKVLVDGKIKRIINRVMSSFERCDICKKIIKKRAYWVRSENNSDYCEMCWLDKKNWPKIHKVEVKVASV
jgi:NMD protein affecting ribosome stability and mRNA decay